MPSTSVTFSLSPTNVDLDHYDSVTVVSQGAISIPAGSTITGGSLYFSSMRVYASSLYFWISSGNDGSKVMQTERAGSTQNSGSKTFYSNGSSYTIGSTMTSIEVHFSASTNQDYGVNCLRLGGSNTCTLTLEYREGSGGGGGGDEPDPSGNPPDTPNDTTITFFQPIYSKKVEVSWNAATLYNYSHDPTYKLFDTGYSTSTALYSGAATSCSITPRAYATSRTYRVRVSHNGYQVDYWPDQSFTASKPTLFTKPSISIAESFGKQAELSWTQGVFRYAEGTNLINYRIYGNTTSSFSGSSLIYTTPTSRTVATGQTALSVFDSTDSTAVLDARTLKAAGFRSGQTIYLFVQPYYSGTDANAKNLNQTPTSYVTFLFQAGSLLSYSPDGQNFYNGEVFYSHDGQTFVQCEVYYCYDGSNFILCST